MQETELGGLLRSVGVGSGSSEAGLKTCVSTVEAPVLLLAAGRSDEGGGVEEYHDLAVMERKTGRRGKGDVAAMAALFLRKSLACADSRGASCWSIGVV